MLKWTDRVNSRPDTLCCDKSLVTALIGERDLAIELKRTEQEFPFQIVFTSQLTCEITVLPHKFDLKKKLL